MFRILQFYRVPDLFCLLQTSFVIQLCLVYRNLDVYVFFLLRSYFAIQLCLVYSDIDVDMFRLSRSSFAIYIFFVCRYPLLLSRFI